MIDNILDMRYLSTLIPRMADEHDWDLRIHYEVKADLRLEHLQALFDAKVTDIQPGIESLNCRLLRAMDKGVTGARNVQLLRDARRTKIVIGTTFTASPEKWRTTMLA